MLKPLDIVVGLKAHLWGDVGTWSYERLAGALEISASQAHTSLRRLEGSGLYRASDRSLRTHAFTLFATHGIPFVFPAELGGQAFGMPTAHAAPPLRGQLSFAESYVWPGPAGVIGRAVPPLHPAAPTAAAADPTLYAALSLVDALRVGRARERRLAVDGLEHVLSGARRDHSWLQEQRAAWQAQ